MQNKKTVIPELGILYREKAAICITVIIPVSPKHSGASHMNTHKMIRQTKQLLRSNYQPAEISTLLHELDELVTQVHCEHETEGIGLYLSPNIKQLIYFPFAVQERILVSNRFELRELLYKEDQAIPYCVLLLTKQHARLFNGMLHTLTEVRDGEFPLVNDSGYEYANPAPSSSGTGYAHTKSVEKDKSVMESIRLKDFFRKVDKALKPYLLSGRKLILLAVEKELSLFADVTHHGKEIIGKREGDYDKADLHQLAGIAWLPVKDWMHQQQLSILKELTEKAGAGMNISGVQHTWTAAREGKGLKLLVEKDYRQPGFITGNELQLHLRPSKNTTKIIADAVEDVIGSVLDNNGEVYFFENGALREFDHIAMIARYK